MSPIIKDSDGPEPAQLDTDNSEPSNASTTPFPEDITGSISNLFCNGNTSSLKSMEIGKPEIEVVEDLQPNIAVENEKTNYINNVVGNNVKFKEYEKEKNLNPKVDKNNTRETKEPRLKRSQSLRIRPKTNETDSILRKEKRKSVSGKIESTPKDGETRSSAPAEDDKPGKLKSFATRFTRFSRISLTDIPEKLERPSFHNLRRSQSMRITSKKTSLTSKQTTTQLSSVSSTNCTPNPVRRSLSPKNVISDVSHRNISEPRRSVKNSKSLLDVRETFRNALNNQNLISHTLNNSLKKSSPSLLDNCRNTTLTKKIRNSTDILNEPNNDKKLTHPKTFAHKTFDVIRKTVQSKFRGNSEKNEVKTDTIGSNQPFMKGISDSVKRKNSKIADIKTKNQNNINSKRKKIESNESENDPTTKQNLERKVSSGKEIKKIKNISTTTNPLKGNKQNSSNVKGDYKLQNILDNTKMLNKKNKIKILTKNQNIKNKLKEDSPNSNLIIENQEKIESDLNFGVNISSDGCESRNAINISDKSSHHNSISEENTLQSLYLGKIDPTTNKNMYSYALCKNSDNESIQSNNLNEIEMETRYNKFLELTNPYILETSFSRFSSSLPMILANINLKGNSTKQTEESNIIKSYSETCISESSMTMSFHECDMKSLSPISNSHDEEERIKREFTSPMSFTDYDAYIDENIDDYWLEGKEELYFGTLFAESKLIWESLSESFQDMDVDEHFIAESAVNQEQNRATENTNDVSCLQATSMRETTGSEHTSQMPPTFTHVDADDLKYCMTKDNCKFLNENVSIKNENFHKENESNNPCRLEAESNNPCRLEAESNNPCQLEAISYCVSNETQDTTKEINPSNCKSDVLMTAFTDQLINSEEFRNHTDKSSCLDLAWDKLEASLITEQDMNSGIKTYKLADDIQGTEADMGESLSFIPDLIANVNVIAEDRVNGSVNSISTDLLTELTPFQMSEEVEGEISDTTLNNDQMCPEVEIFPNKDTVDEKPIVSEVKVEDKLGTKMVKGSDSKILKAKTRLIKESTSKKLNMKSKINEERKLPLEIHLKNKNKKDRKLNKLVLCTPNGATKITKLKENIKQNNLGNNKIEINIKKEISVYNSVIVNNKTEGPTKTAVKRIDQETNQEIGKKSSVKRIDQEIGKKTLVKRIDQETSQEIGKKTSVKRIDQETNQEVGKRLKIAKSPREAISLQNEDAKELATNNEGEGSASAGLGTPGGRANAKDRANRAPPTRASSRLGAISVANDEKIRQEVSTAASNRRPKIDISKSPLTKIARGTTARTNQTDPVKVLRPTAPTTQPRPSVVTSSEQLKKLESELFARTQEVEKAKEEAARASRGFEALSVIINHLTNEYDAFSTPSLKAEIDRISTQLTNVQLSLDESTAAARRLEDEATDRCQKQVEEIRNLETLHRNEIASITLEHQRKTEQIVEQHQLELREAVTKEQTKHEEIINSHKVDLERVDKEWRDQLGQQHERHLQALEQLNTCHTQQLRESEASWEAKEKELQENNAMLLKEQGVLKQQAKKLEETLLSDKDHRLQAAKRVCTALQNEVDSLKTVVEMRNNEVHKLRDQLTDKEQLSEDLEAARERVRALQAKTEDLHAQMEKKSQLERQLLADHHNLSDTLQRESCSNKRLSLENEELQWKLRQREGAIPGTHSTSTLDLVTRCTTVIARQQDGCKSGGLSHQGTLRSQRIGTRSQPYKSEQEKHWSRSFSNISEDAGKFLRRSELQNEDVTIESPPPSPRVKSVIEKSNSVSFILDLNDTLPNESFLGLPSSPLTKKPRTPTLPKKILHKSYSNILEKSSSTSVIPGRTKEICFHNSLPKGNGVQSKYDTKFYTEKDTFDEEAYDYASVKSAEDRNKMSNGKNGKTHIHSMPNYNNRGYSTSESSDGGEMERISPTGLSWTVPVHPKVKRYSNSKNIPNRYHMVPETPRLLQQPDEDEYEETENEFVEVLTLGEDVNSSPLTNLFNQTPSTSVSLSDSDISQCGSRADLSTEDECSDDDEGTQRITMQNDSSHWRPQEGAGEAMIFPDVFELKGDKKIVGLKENCKEISKSQISSAPSSDSEETNPQPLNGESGLNMSWSEEIDCDLTSSSEMQEL